MFHGKPIKYHPRFMVKSPECQNFLETSSEGVQASGRPGTADGQCQAGPRGGEAGWGGRDAPKLGDFTRENDGFLQGFEPQHMGISLGNMVIFAGIWAPEMVKTWGVHWQSMNWEIQWAPVRHGDEKFQFKQNTLFSFQTNLV